MRGKEAGRRAGIGSHPEAVEIGDAIVGTFRLDHAGFVDDRNRRCELVMVPEGAASGNIDIDDAVRFGDDAWLFEFGDPVAAKAGGEQGRQHGE